MKGTFTSNLSLPVPHSSGTDKGAVTSGARDGGGLGYRNLHPELCCKYRLVGVMGVGIHLVKHCS